MFIRYYSAIEQPRVYGFLLSFKCIPNASTILKRKMYKAIDHSDQDCFFEDNSIEFWSTKDSRSWRIPGFGDRYYKKMPDSRVDFDKITSTAALKRSRLGDQPFNKRLRNEENVHHWNFR